MTIATTIIAVRRLALGAPCVPMHGAGVVEYDGQTVEPPM